MIAGQWWCAGHLMRSGDMPPPLHTHTHIENFDLSLLDDNTCTTLNLCVCVLGGGGGGGGGFTSILCISYSLWCQGL